MKYTIVTISVIVLFFTATSRTYAWGKKGHEIVAEIAFHYLDDSTKARVQHYLGKMSIEEAAVWMDDMRSNSYYDYMKPWHYINIEKGENYKPSPKERDILIILNSSINELKHKENLKFKNIHEALCPNALHKCANIHFQIIAFFEQCDKSATYDCPGSKFTSR